MLDPVFEAEHDPVGRAATDQIDPVHLVGEYLAELGGLVHHLRRNGQTIDNCLLIHINSHRNSISPSFVYIPIGLFGILYRRQEHSAFWALIREYLLRCNGNAIIW